MNDVHTHKDGDEGRLPKVVTVLLYVSMALLLISAGNLYLTNRSREQLRDTQVVLHKVDHNVDQLNRFVDDLKTQTPEEKKRNEQIAAVLILVPQIKALLCDHVGPSSELCQSP